MVAYQLGNAANVAPAATTSQHLVPVPDRADRLEHRPPILFTVGTPWEEREQHPYAEVEPFEHEVRRPADGHHAEPEDLEVHQ